MIGSRYKKYLGTGDYLFPGERGMGAGSFLEGSLGLQKNRRANYGGGNVTKFITFLSGKALIRALRVAFLNILYQLCTGNATVVVVLRQ